MAQLRKAKCPECGAPIEIDEFLDIEDTTTCTTCGAELCIVRTDPLLLEVVEYNEDERDSTGEEDFDNAEDEF